MDTPLLWGIMAGTEVDLITTDFMTPNFYNLLSTDIQPSNERIADHCSITACFKVRQSGSTDADMNLKPQHVCHGGCPKHILRRSPDKALHYAEHL